MALDVLQTYIESKLVHCIKRNVDLRTIKSENVAASSKKIPQIFVVHADSCRKYVYPSSTDWVCGGQWNEMLSNLEKFVRSFRQSNTELVVFFDGSINSFRVREWKSRQNNQRENVKQLMSKVVSYRALPSRNLAVIPACFNTALRLALKSCNVMVCSSLAQVHRDIANYYLMQNCSAIIAHSSYYLLQGVTNCFLPDQLKLGRYNVRASCVDFEAVMKELGLNNEALPAFASLIGSVLIPEKYLAAFHWTFLAADHPLRKVELMSHPSYQNMPPPNDIIIKGVADFLQNKNCSDIDALAAEAFKDESYNLAEATAKLKESIDYFKQANQIPENITDTESLGDLNQYGFPVHTFGVSTGDKPPSDPKDNENSYQQRWQQFQKVQMNARPLAVEPQAVCGSVFMVRDVKMSDVQGEEEVTAEEVGCKEDEENATEERDKVDEEENVKEIKSEEERGKEDEVDAKEEERVKEEDLTIQEDEEIKKEEEVRSEEDSKKEEEFSEGELKEEEVKNEEKQEELIADQVQEKDEKEAKKSEVAEPGCGLESCEDEKQRHGEESEADDNKEKPVDESVTASAIVKETLIALVDKTVSEFNEDASIKVCGSPYEDMKAVLPSIPKEVLSVARKRHQAGEMTQEILQILTNGELLIDTGIDEENPTMRQPIPLLYRPIRQLIYGILYDQKIHEQSKGQDEADHGEGDIRVVKEYCVCKGNVFDNPDLVEVKCVDWDIPSVKTLWLGRQAEDNTARMKAFLTCMKSDTTNIPNTTMVPQNLLLLCCVLRYLIQQEDSKPIIRRYDIDAFLAQALSPHMTTESNSMNLANIKLNQIDVSAMQLASIFMSGIETAIMANDACGSPVPWEFCCPWLFFDGKLFHSKWLQASMNVATLELCDGKPHLAEKLERLRWCITEGLEDNFKISGLKPSAFSSGLPFGPTPASHAPAPAYGVNNYRPAGANPIHPMQNRNKGRGASSKRPVLGSGGTLEVAGVPVAHWSGNKSGIGYVGQSNDVIVGGRACVDLPSESRYGRRGSGRGRIANRGRGLLPTPLFSPWPVEYDGMRGVQSPFGRGPPPPNQMPPGGPHMGRPQARSLYKPTLSSGNRRNDYNNLANTKRRMPPSQPLSKQPDIWLGRGRGISIDSELGRIPRDEKPANSIGGRGWIQ
eukprot:gene6008-6706_t